MTFGSLFSGIGGLDLGLEWAGFTAAWQVEIDPWCRAVLARHWPEVQRYDDVQECSAATLAPVEALVGGFPCQDISAARRDAPGIEGPKSGLWQQYARLIRELRPAYVLVENVPALRYRGLDAVLGDLAACGYDAEWECLPAASVGAPHLRDRLFVVAYANGLRPGTRAVEVFGELRPEALFRHQAVERRANEAREVFRGPGASQWSSEPRVGRVVDGIPTRLDRRRLRGLGNAVVPQVAHLIGNWIIQAERRRIVQEAA